MPKSKLTPKENTLRVLRRRDPEYVPYRQRPRYIPGIELVSSPNALAPKSGPDIWGVGWLAADGGWEAYPAQHPFRTVEEMADMRFPQPQEMVAGLQQRIAAVNRDDALVVVHQPRGIFERSHLLLGMEPLFTAMIDSPDTLGYFYNRLADYYIEVAKLHCELGIDGFRVTDDYGSQTSLLMSPDQWRRLIKPAMARWISAYKQEGKFFFMHSCGYITQILGDLVEIGIDVIDSLNPSAGNELDMWKQKYGDRLSFMGGVDTHYVLSFGTPQEVREEVRLRLRQLAAGGGYILGPDQSIAIPDANYEAYIRTAEEFCRYPLREDL